MINLYHGYSVQLKGYDVWGEYFMTLIRFKQIFSALHPEAGIYLCGEKCYHLRYFIRMFNDKAKIIFVLGEHGDFDGRGIFTRSSYCPVCMYNKDKPNKCRVFFHLGRCQV